MLKVNNKGVISLTRGDSASLTVNVTDSNGGEYSLQDTDVLRLSVKQTVEDAAYAFQKMITGTNVFNIVPADTSGLTFGEYVYDVQLTNADGDVYTIIPPTVFNVLEEVT